MTDGLLDLDRVDRLRTARQAAADHVDLARWQLETRGGDAVPVARQHLEAAVATLQPVTCDDTVPRRDREELERWRASLASHLLAARDVDDAGAAASTTARLLLRATKTR